MIQTIVNMGKKKDIVPEVKEIIITCHKNGKSLRQISAKMQVSVGAVRNALKVMY